MELVPKMNKSIIESIYNADELFYEQNINTQEFFQAKKEFCESYEKLLSLLKGKQKELLDDVFCLHENMQTAGYVKKFKDGFILGFKLAEEIFNGN